jgi:hypothetical protein
MEDKDHNQLVPQSPGQFDPGTARPEDFEISKPLTQPFNGQRGDTDAEEKELLAKTPIRGKGVAVMPRP